MLLKQGIKIFIFYFLFFSNSSFAFDQDIAASKIVPSVPAGWSVELIAESPNIIDPVAFSFDEKGRVYVCESFRQEIGVEDNRSSSFWLLDDLANRTNEDRLAMYKKYASYREGGMEYYRRGSGQLRRLSDVDQDGYFETVEPYAMGFNDYLDGTIAGVLSRDGETWVTNIPNLWRVKDMDQDGKAEVQEKLHSGFGVRIALRGHDMHGLTWGPEGRLWFTIGDRGYHIELPSGEVLSDPRSGAVFRCEPDGSGLEVYATSLRNPQEIAFDIYGNLITGDNNSDAGDSARIVHVVEGGESGWAMEYQTLEGDNQRGPWNQEKLWHLQFEGQAAWILPPIAHVGSGPSGLTYDPGVALPQKFKDNFFLCDFRGDSSQSSIVSFALKPKGASFKVVNVNQIVQNVLPTDVDFDYSGNLIISDYGDGWFHNGVGRLWKVNPAKSKLGSKGNVKEIMYRGFVDLEVNLLQKLLRHKDRRIRQRAQFELANRPEGGKVFLDLAFSSEPVCLRLHGIWGFAQLARLCKQFEKNICTKELENLLPLLSDPEPIIRAQVARVLGEGMVEVAGDLLADVALLDDPMVAYHAVMAVGRLKNVRAVDVAAALLTKNKDKDPFLRHAAVMALSWSATAEDLEELSVNVDRSVRLGALLAMRLRNEQSIVRFLTDDDSKIVLEAARAIYDKEQYSLFNRLIAKGRSEINNSYFQEPTKGHVIKYEAVNYASPTLEKLEILDFKLNRAKIFSGEKPRGLKSVAGAIHGQASLVEDFSGRLFGTLKVPADGAYQFQVTADDRAILRIAVNGDPSITQEILRIDSYTEKNDWSNVSEPVYLSQGSSCWFELRYANDKGPSHAMLGWRMPGETFEQPIGRGLVDSDELALMRRIAASAEYLGTKQSIDFIGELAIAQQVSPSIRILALKILESWDAPGPRERVLGRVVNFKEDRVQRKKDKLEVLATCLPVLINDSISEISEIAIRLASLQNLTLDSKKLISVIENKELSAAIRVAALKALALESKKSLSSKRLFERVIEAVSFDDKLAPEIGIILYELNKEKSFSWVLEALKDSRVAVRRSAINVLGQFKTEAADEKLADLLDSFLEGELSDSLQLDVLVNAELRRDNHLINDLLDEWEADSSQDVLLQYEPALFGGSLAVGEEIFKYRGSVSCMRCHSIEGIGGVSGPPLDNVGNRLTNLEILESLVEPNSSVVEGYGSTSSMPGVTAYLNSLEIRDLVAYLSSLKE